MAQLAQGLAAGVALEQLLGHLIRQPGVLTMVAVVNTSKSARMATSSGPVIRPRRAAPAEPRDVIAFGWCAHGVSGFCQHSPQLAWRAAWQICCSERAAGVDGAVTFIRRFLSRASGSGSEGQPPVFTHHGWPF